MPTRNLPPVTRKQAVCMIAVIALSLRTSGADAPDTASNAQLNGHRLRFSMVVPAIAEDIRMNLPRLMVSVALQTIMPLEVILVISGVESIQCEAMKSSLVAVIEFYLLWRFWREGWIPH